ncbi:hypothetical protein ACK3TF_000516 [Chlorella vulgaris]
MKGLLCAAAFAGLLVLCSAGSGKDIWGETTLVNYPPGRTRLTVPNQANDVGAPAPIDLKCQCSDADPREELSQEVSYTCFYQRHFGNCNQDYLFDANAELAPEGFCQISCSRCNCCQSPAEVLQQLGATRFLQAANATSPGLTDLLTHPGWTGTLLVPTDAAFDAALAQYQSLLQNPPALQQLLKFHILPPEPVRRGLWTSPFLSLGPKLYTAYDGPNTLSSSKFSLPAGTTYEGGVAGFAIQGPYNSANSDVPSCKGYITLVDAVLLPFDPAVPLPTDFTAAGAMLGAAGCAVQPNALIRGTQVLAGESNRQATIGDCCDSCAATSSCNAWRYCSQKGGCPMPNGTPIPYGFCALLSSPELAAGQAPTYEDFSAATVPLASGFPLAGPVKAAPVTAPVAEATPAPPMVVAAGGNRRMRA